MYVIFLIKHVECFIYLQLNVPFVAQLAYLILFVTCW